ncbi:hypothetical protein J7I98_14145 [Streptomyces sp. ISL-98]|uniref:hypothetical protein n=1 Tax=Streptomyces sp. ISL-98 TaxID=2819192 RepID=UPI001BEB7AFE|nr:hypothetical protein [Streptomyces sp. ISL-98]MBT2507009.1 hypothetical protein [Streptomyces sp. ISL-98]
MDETDEVGPVPRGARDLSSWERRLFAGVRMVSADEQAEIAATSRHRPEGPIRDPSPDESHWYGQRLSGTASAQRDEN